MRHRLLNWLLLVGTCLLIVFIDRMVLFAVGQTRWQYDPVLGYRMRAHWQLASYTGIESATNAWGHHDGDFPLRKPARQLRGVIIGDSVTMGVHLHQQQSYANQLESLLERFDSRYTSYQIINTGVEGYDANQEYHMLIESLRFDPDFIVVGLCLNDITDPYLIDRAMGGSGRSRYSTIEQTTFPLWGYLINETGFGRLVLKVREGHYRAEELRRTPLYSVERMVASPGASQWAEGWNRALGDLAAMYQVADERQIPIVLAVFPYTFQLFQPDLQSPQKRLVAHASEHHTDSIDYAPLLEEASRMRLYTNLLQPEAEPVQPSEEGDLARFASQVYFQDLNHFTAAGNELVALYLAEYLRIKGLVDMAPNFLPRQREELRRQSVDFDRRLPVDLESLRERQRVLRRLGLEEQVGQIEAIIEQRSE